MQRFEVNKIRWVSDIYKTLENKNFNSRGFYEFYINEQGKRRFIQSVHISERTIQKALTNMALKPLILPKLIYDNSASVEGKGTDFAINRLKYHLARHYRKYGREGGILILDFKNYFASIEHNILKKELKYYIKDEELYDLTEKFISCYNNKGIGLGSEVSQIFAISFPNKLDYYIQNNPKTEVYARFMDDSYVISNDLEYLKELKDKIIKYSSKLGLTINTKRIQIIKFNGGSFTYLKKRFMINSKGKIVIRLSREAIARQRRKLKKQLRLLNKKQINMEHIQMSYISWRGMAKKYNTYKTIYEMDCLYKKLFKEDF